MAQMTELSSVVQRAFISIEFNGAAAIAKQQNRTIMKIKMIVCTTLAAALLAGCITEKSEARQAKLTAKARISRDHAEKTALAKVPNGAIKEAEIEKEHGKLIWSFDMTTPDTKDITEVNVDAVTGDVVSVEKESAESEAKEAAGGKDKD
jgi:uncharacterized membrane protein YkoI